MSIKPEKGALASTTRRLGELAALPDDWDSYGASPISPGSIQAAEDLLRTLDAQTGWRPGTTMAPSHIAPLPSGGVQLEWAGPAMDIEVEVSAQGRLAYLLIDRTGNGRRFTEDEDVSSATVVALVTRVLRS